MLYYLSQLTDRWGNAYDLAAVNFWLSWTGAIGSLVLMTLVMPKRNIRTFAGRIAWVRACGLFWLTIALALGGSYPVYENAQPWLPTVVLTGTVVVLVVMNIVVEIHEANARRTRHAPRSAARKPT